MGDSNTQTVLEHILINTYNADQTLRSQAEDALSQYLCKHGSLYHMTIFLGNPQIHRDLRYIMLYILYMSYICYICYTLMIITIYTIT